MALSCNPSYLEGYRTVGWLEVEWRLPPDKSDSVAALGPRPPPLGERLPRRSDSYEEYIEAKLHHTSTAATRVRVPDRPSSQ